MNHNEASYRAYWATLLGKSEREIYVPEALDTSKTVDARVRRLIDDIREDRTTHGAIAVSGRARAEAPDEITVGLARFQSYRARTESALAQEIADLVAESNARLLAYAVDSANGLVYLEAR